MDFISWCDGDKNLLEIADKVKIPIWELYNILELMIKHDLIELIDRDQQVYVKFKGNSMLKKKNKYLFNKLKVYNSNLSNL